MMEREWGRENWVLQTKGGTGLGDEKLGWGSVREEGQGPGFAGGGMPLLSWKHPLLLLQNQLGSLFFSLRLRWRWGRGQGS